MAYPRQAQGVFSKPRTYPVVEAGFSLIELAIVVVIIGVMMTMGLAAMTAARQNQSFSTTIQKQATIKQALISYLRNNTRLPCPDTDFAAPDGIENRTTAGNPATVCSAKFGILPYVTLGLPRDAAQDGWSNFFSYQLSHVAPTDWSLTANFYSGNTGVITVNTRVGILGTVTPLAAGVVALVVSHGPNGFGAYTIGGTRNTLAGNTTDEYLNGNGGGGNIYYKRDSTTDDAAVGGAIDDVVSYMTANDLVGPLFLDGSLQTPAAMVTSVNAAFLKIKTAAIGYALTHSTGRGGSACTTGGTPNCRNVPYADSGTNGLQNPPNSCCFVPWVDLGLVAADAIDPWGTRLRYVVNVAAAANGFGQGISSAQPASSAAAITLTSNGADKTFGTADDIVLNTSVGEIQGTLANFLP